MSRRVWSRGGTRAGVLVGGLVGVLVAGTWSVVTSSPAMAVDPLDLTIQDIEGDQLPAPYVAEEFFAQSQALQTGTDRSQWTCTVDLGEGEGPQPGYWRAKPSDFLAPCAARHTYEAAGTYTITMSVTDPEGDTETASVVVEVTARTVQDVDAGTEGTRIRLRGPGSKATWSLTRDGDADAGVPCLLDRSPAPDVLLTCRDEGTYRVDYDTGDAETSGGYVVTYANGAPRPTARPARVVVRESGTALQRVRRVGTGDEVVVDVRANDPSTGASGGVYGDRLTCRFDHGNRHREVQVADPARGRCNGRTSYQRPGRKVSTVKVGDGDGGRGTTTATVVVVRRDVHLAVRDVAAGGPRGAVTASLTPRGLRGKVVVSWPGGPTVRSTRLNQIAVARGGATLRGTATLDGRTGFRFAVFPDRTYPQGIAFSILVWREGKPGRYVVDEQVGRREFRVRLQAPPVR